MPGPEVTYWLGRSFWGRGIASAALALFLAELPVRPLFGRAAATNVASLRVLERSGFRRIEATRDWSDALGREVEEVILRLDAPGPAGGSGVDSGSRTPARSP